MFENYNSIIPFQIITLNDTRDFKKVINVVNQNSIELHDSIMCFNYGNKILIHSVPNENNDVQKDDVDYLNLDDDDTNDIIKQTMI